MALLFQIAGATRLDDHVWKALLSPAEARLLGPNAPSAGATTVVLLADEATFDAGRRQLAFDPAKARLLNAGTSDSAILIGIAAKPSSSVTGGNMPSISAPPGDAKFLALLPTQLRFLGESLLGAVRTKFPGELKFYEDSGRYIDTPDNFWTIKPQSRDVSFRITVRGTAESFHGVRTLQLKPDRHGYSTFKIARAGQIDDFIRLLGQVRRK
jgi:hypothetical protein